MYWKIYVMEVYIKGEYYDYVGGEKVLVFMVMYIGVCSYVINYVCFKLEDLKFYQEDVWGMYLVNGMLEGRLYEWVNISKIGNII